MANPENIHFFTLIHHNPTSNSDKTSHQVVQSVLKFLPGEAYGIIHQNNKNFQWQKLPPGNLGCNFQMRTYDLGKRKSHLKLTKQVHSSGLGNIFTARCRAGSNTSQSTPRAVTHTFSSHAHGSLPDVAHGQSIVSSVQRSHARSTRATGEKVWASAGHRLCPSAKLGSTRLSRVCLHLCLRADNPDVGPA